ncbi:heparinase II/III family protein [Sphingomonas asaccharolytica]|uniref:heparinase II/III family protein n=1 Tax=Sphingomonas asaccharolytica TaxID=40681 RepID=UPI00082D538B|nr:heparinase II/III family protein [Sphingomonas asaccharolytica]
MIERTGTGWTLTFLAHSHSFSATLDWDQPQRSPREQLWRMNLHYMEYLEELGATDAYSLIEQWIAANPPYRRGYWRDAWNSYAVSLRVVVWMQTIALNGAAPRAITDSLAGQLLFLEENLERDIGGNHLIKNIKALAWGSAFFDGPLAVRWRALAIRLLSRELPRQVLPDGMHYERSPSYHCQVFADLIEMRHALDCDPLGGALDSALTRMAAVIPLLTHPDGFVAEFNDAGLTMAYSPDACLDAYEAVSGRSRARVSGAFALPNAGYFGYRKDADYVVVDMGRIGPDDLPAHAHGDIGSVELSIDGHRLIVDRGVERYVAGPERTASRSAASHNVLSLVGGDQADFFGAFRCGRRPQVVVTTHDVFADGFVIEGWHDGYASLPGGPIVHRRVETRGDTVTITDRVKAREWREGSTGLLLHPDCTVALDGIRAAIELDSRRLSVEASAPLTIVAATWSPDMGHSVATHRISLTLPPGCFEASFVLRRTNNGSPGNS